MSENSTSSVSSVTSSTSTVYNSQEPFDSFQHRVTELCRTVLGAEGLEVERLKGGAFNQIVLLRLPGREYVLRVPRWPDISIAHDVAPLELLLSYEEIPAPAVVTFDMGSENALGRPYMIQQRIPGRQLLYEYPSLPHQTKCAVARDLGRVFSTMHSIRSEAAGRLIWNEERIWLETWDPKRGVVALTDVAGGGAEEGTEWILRVLQSRHTEAVEGKMGYRIEFFEKLITIAKGMGRMGVWQMGNACCLCHRDLEPRNILVGQGGITGILDWDSAVFGPLLSSCSPPMWLWAWKDNGPEDLRQAGDIPSTPEARELKQLFEASAGPIYALFAYEPQYRLARRLIQWMIDWPNSSEEWREFDLFCEEWAVIEGTFGTRKDD
ncbi:hypothetical protein N7540_003482 [Penicillium herquei]|nr:hypothetical protein N7540_003482 [Penicillium herquei]